MKWFFNGLPFALIGSFIGAGSYSLLDWQWWAMVGTLIAAFNIRDTVNE